MLMIPAKSVTRKIIATVSLSFYNDLASHNKLNQSFDSWVEEALKEKLSREDGMVMSNA